MAGPTEATTKVNSGANTQSAGFSDKELLNVLTKTYTILTGVAFDVNSESYKTLVNYMTTNSSYKKDITIFAYKALVIVPNMQTFWFSTDAVSTAQKAKLNELYNNSVLKKLMKDYPNNYPKTDKNFTKPTELSDISPNDEVADVSRFLMFKIEDWFPQAEFLHNYTAWLSTLRIRYNVAGAEPATLGYKPDRQMLARVYGLDIQGLGVALEPFKRFRIYMGLDTSSKDLYLQGTGKQLPGYEGSMSRNDFVVQMYYPNYVLDLAKHGVSRLLMGNKQPFDWGNARESMALTYKHRMINNDMVVRSMVDPSRKESDDIIELSSTTGSWAIAKLTMKSIGGSFSPLAGLTYDYNSMMVGGGLQFVFRDDNWSLNTDLTGLGGKYHCSDVAGDNSMISSGYDQTQAGQKVTGRAPGAGMYDCNNSDIQGTAELTIDKWAPGCGPLSVGYDYDQKITGIWQPQRIMAGKIRTSFGPLMDIILSGGQYLNVVPKPSNERADDLATYRARMDLFLNVVGGLVSYYYGGRRSALAAGLDFYLMRQWGAAGTMTGIGANFTVMFNRASEKGQKLNALYYPSAYASLCLMAPYLRPLTDKRMSAEVAERAGLTDKDAKYNMLFGDGMVIRKFTPLEASTPQDIRLEIKAITPLPTDAPVAPAGKKDDKTPADKKADKPSTEKKDDKQPTDKKAEPKQ